MTTKKIISICVLLSFVVCIFSACGNASEKSEIKTKVICNDFESIVINDLKDMFNPLELPEFESDNGEEKFTSYVLSERIKDEEMAALFKEKNIDLPNIHFSITSATDTNYVKSIHIMTEHGNHIYLSIVLNLALLAIEPNMNIEEVDAKCNLAPYSADDTVVQYEKFDIFKDTSDEYESVFVTLK